MQKRPEFSIVIPVYNRECEIQRAIESCLAQGEVDYEVIVVDDASQDRSAEVVAGYANQGVRLVQQPVNLGSSPARTAGMNIATGDWIVRMDSDEELLPGALERMRVYTSSVPESVGRLGFMFRYLDGRVSPFPPPSGKILFYEDFVQWLENTEMYDCLTVIRRSALAVVPLPKGRLTELVHHLDFAMRYGTLWIPEVTAIYHIDANERQSKGRDTPVQAREDLEETRLILSRHGDALRRLAPRFHQALLRKITVSLALIGERHQALREGARQLLSFPFSGLHWAALGCVMMGHEPLSIALKLKWWLVEERRKRFCKPRLES